MRSADKTCECPLEDVTATTNKATGLPAATALPAPSAGITPNSHLSKRHQMTPTV